MRGIGRVQRRENRFWNRGVLRQGCSGRRLFFSRDMITLGQPRRAAGEQLSMIVFGTKAWIRTAIGTLAATCGAALLSDEARAQSVNQGLVKDSETGVVYQKRLETIQRPVVEQRIDRQETMVYRPETVKQTKPEVSTIYMPVTQVKWKPYVEGRWNPFQQPRVAYRQVPETRWEARSQVVDRTTIQTRWVPEKQTVEIPHSIVRYQTEQRETLTPVDRLAASPAAAEGVSPAVAARLRPLDPSDRLASRSNAQLASTRIAPTIPAPPNTMTIVSNSVGRTSSHPPLRTSMQQGMRTNVLMPQTTYGTAVPQAPSNVATVPSFSLWR